MLKVKKLIEQKQSLSTLKDKVDSIESSLQKGENASIDGSKTLVEGLCKTFLSDHEIEYSSGEQFPELVKKTFTLVCIDQNISQKDSESFTLIFDGIHDISRGIAQLRNHHGYFSHGQDLHARMLDEALLTLAVDVCDAVACYLINTQTQFDIQKKRLVYSDQWHFNSWYDSNNPLSLSEIALSASKTIFDQDIEAYKEFLAEFTDRLNNNDEDLLSDLAELAIDVDSDDPLPYLYCPKCTSSQLSRSSATDQDHDETYFSIECSKCGWSEWTQ